MRRIVFAGLTGLCFMTVGCAGPAGGHSQTQKSDAMSGPKVAEGDSSGMVTVVNAWCPIATDNPVSSNKMTEKQLTRMWRGQRIGFCCDACPNTWDAMNDEAKSAALASAIKREMGTPRSDSH